ncbi:DUF1573 domain-containing protein [Tenacibaculum maritimum]|uniref:DUF1573 domain-containing protein n=1 Tax=Tenacibaculum maritimum TaxID=107401 RepID=UPI001E348C8A|nr:DUF1573 domain-containing protein [Tenacibaculum maritimum]MCD9585353.1 DUF1573 domain-containing protein [Tenacibaculum maritimum]MCD9610480.1 DUF1573 domain-containing protein [Tenacibaculum maritimum]MCD9621845.1 DUF1573 domain-containing protein [Tenacibaculum maritimum]MCD9628215.1 DUF1573 domain-containing protein [Tenacibaculum maritimum]MCD9630658.1 DUF1573 domain-containing protein [Tenacibaculum maritimum]
MKKVFIAVVTLALSSVMISCGNNNATSKVKKENVLNAEKRDNDISKGAPAIKFDRTVHDFGTVNEGEIVETSFTITNSGNSNLVITNAQATCGCTVPVWPKEAIAPGKTGEIKVKFNTSGKPNKQSKSVTLHTNTAQGREVVKITGMVTPKNKKPNA